MPKPVASPLSVILLFAAGLALVLGVAVMVHRHGTPELPVAAMRMPSGPGDAPKQIPRASSPASAGAAPQAQPLTPSVPAPPAVTMARSDLAVITEAKQEPVVEIRTAVAMPSTTEAGPRAMLINPLPEPKFRPFIDSISDYFRAVQPAANGIPPVYSAVLQDDAEWLSQLLSEGYSPNSTTVGGDSALCAAVWFGFEDCVRVLLLHGADANLVGRDQQPPLALASLRRNHDILKSLLLAGANANARFVSPAPRHVLQAVTVGDLRNSLSYDEGVTPLMACTSRGDVEGVIALMQHGAKSGIGTKKFYRYPINFSCEQKYLFISRILLGRSPDAEPDLLVTVDLSKQKAWITRGETVIDSTMISSGRAGFSTPPGRYVVTDKHKSWISTLYKVPMPWFMRLDCSAIGLHSGHVTGRPASHGCIRLPHDKARDFFNVVKVGDEVQIIR